MIASYEENLGSRPGHNGGDGTSASSVGTASPDIFQGELNACCPIDGIAVLNSVYSDEQHQEMTNECKKPASSMVTYVESFSPNGSHLNLNAMENYAEGVRTSRNRGVLDGKSSGSDFEGYERLNDDNSSDHNNDEDENEVSAFTREPARKSLKSDHLDRWISMQESYSGVCG